jgi:KDO2-lipid IV(A) lauroyltransferase
MVSPGARESSAKVPRFKLPHLRIEGGWARRAAYVGARHGPRFLLEHGPTVFGLVFAALLGETRQRVRRNLRRAAGERPYWSETWDVGRTFVTYAHCLAESLAFDRPEAAQAECRPRDEGGLAALADRTQGVVLATAHAGGWDVATRLFSKDFGREVIVVMEPEPDEAARSLHDELRQRAGVRIAHVRHPLDGLELLRHLRRGGAVAIQVDRVPPGLRSLPVSLGDGPFAFPEGPFALAAAAGVPLVPMFARRRGFFQYDVVVGAPVRLAHRPSAAELALAARVVAEGLERFLRDNPTQWFHFAPEP